MKKGLLCFILSVALVLGFAGYSWSQDTIMQPDRETRLKWIQWFEEAPEAPVDPAVLATIPAYGSLSLLSNLQYTPSERNQASCGNCWAWAGQGLMGIDLNIQEGIRDRLSVQYINSCETAIIGKTCCDGGWLQDVADFYNHASIRQAIPWSNTNAHWVDGDASCDGPACGSISTSPNYPINSMTVNSITTHNVAQATAIANIKAQLHANNAVWWGFFLPNWDSWNGTAGFRTVWNGSGESTIWQPDQWCGQTWTSQGGGHAVLCVGYNDDDPNNRYWIMLNSWGTAGGGRPNGLFRMNMDMDYGCTFVDGGSYWSFYWQTATIDWGAMNCCTKPTPVAPSGQSATDQPTYQWSCSGAWDYFQVYVQNVSTGTTHGSGWVSSSANTWTQPSGLDWGSYRWWVIVWDSGCGYSEWSDPMDFTVGDCCPKPTLGVNTSGGDPVFSWSCGSAGWEYAYVYVLNLSNGAVVTSGWLNGSQVSQWTATGLPWGNYRAYVLLYHSQCGYAEWSDPIDFTNGNCCPKPGNLSANTSGADPVISWGCGSAGWEYAYVYLQNLSTGAVYSSGWLSGGASQWTATGLPWGSWRVWVMVYHSQCGYSEWSDPLDFTVGSCCAKPTLSSVADGTAQPTFSWSCSGEWEYFKVWVYNSTTGVAYDGGWIYDPNQTMYAWPFALPWGHYWAYVMVYHSQCGFSEWSAPRDWTVGGTCCDQPTLSTPSGSTPTYSWSCGSAGWTYFWVYVQNLGTGAYYGTGTQSNGWVHDSGSSWVSAYTLPAGNYRAWVAVYHENCGVSLWSINKDWTVGGGGGASLRFYNAVWCQVGQVRKDFTATLTMCGEALSSYTENWSTCRTATPATCSWTLTANAHECGTIDWNGTYAVAAGRVYNFYLWVDGSTLKLSVVSENGDCSTPEPWSLDATDATFEVLQTSPNQGFEQAQ